MTDHLAEAINEFTRAACGTTDLWQAAMANGAAAYMEHIRAHPIATRGRTIERPPLVLPDEDEPDRPPRTLTPRVEAEKRKVPTCPLGRHEFQPSGPVLECIHCATVRDEPDEADKNHVSPPGRIVARGVVRAEGAGEPSDEELQSVFAKAWYGGTKLDEPAGRRALYDAGRASLRELEAKVTAWKPTVRRAIEYRESSAQSRGDAGFQLVSAVDAIPAEHRPVKA